MKKRAANNFSGADLSGRGRQKQNRGATAGRGGRRYFPFVFTEHGAIMAAAVLNSQRAVDTSIYVVRAFVKLREILAIHKQFAGRLDDLEKRLTGHDEQFQMVFEAIKQLIEVEAKPKKKIGF